MTATAPNPAAEATPMAHTPDHRPDPPAAEEPAAAKVRPRPWAILGNRPLLALLGTAAAALLTLLGTVAVALLVLTLNSTNNRIDRLEDKVDAGFAAQSAKFDELNLKLTALIAGLNMTDEVDAALEGRLLDSEPPAAGLDDVPR